MLTFWKSRPNNSGFGISFQACKSGLIYSFVKQFSWDEDSQKGIFAPNKGIEGKATSISLPVSEFGKIIIAFGKKIDTSIDLNGKILGIRSFVKDDKFAGYLFEINDVENRQIYKAGLTVDEALLVAEYLRGIIYSIANEDFGVKIELKETKKQQIEFDVSEDNKAEETGFGDDW